MLWPKFELIVPVYYKIFALHWFDLALEHYTTVLLTMLLDLVVNNYGMFSKIEIEKVLPEEQRKYHPKLQRIR